jgi:hypothetical protein
MLTSFVYLLLGFILSNLGYYATRNRESHNSPVKPSFIFFFKDNYIRLIHSALIASIINVILMMDIAQTNKVLGMPYIPIYAVGVGLFPDAILAFLKNKFGFMQPKKVQDEDGSIYKRK